MKKKIVVVGGGTAGWLTSLYLAKNYSYYDITIIDSTKIGILGAGEGGTLILRKLLLDEFGLDEKEFLEKVNGTRKYGITFEGWNENTKYSFVHGFNLNGQEDTYSFAYHFDARLFADYLKEKTLELGVNHIDNEVLNFQLYNNKISKIIFENNDFIDCDFVFDCTGFKRMITGNLYKSKWISFENELIVNTAIPFQFQNDKISIQPKTIASAEKYGWVWQIPLQNRWGCGYIFSDEYADETTIKKEIQELFCDKDIRIGNTIKFEPGCYKEVWKENTISIGLSTGFLEPLEATSIMTTVLQLKKLPKNLFNDNCKQIYNESVFSLNFQNMMFIRHHYNCSREDTQFWIDYKNKNLPNELTQINNSDNDTNIFNIIGIINNKITFRQPQYNHIRKNNFMKGSII